MNISALVLAAGASTRMRGRNKLLLPWGDQTVIERTVDTLLQSRVAEVIVVIGFEADQIQAKLCGRNLKLVVNHDYAQGMSTSIRAGMHAVADNAQAVMIALGDMPLSAAAQLNRLISAFEHHTAATIAVPVFQGRRGHPVIFNLCHKTDLLALRGDAGGKSILERHAQGLAVVEMEDDRVLRDVDTPEEYDAIIPDRRIHGT